MSCPRCGLPRPQKYGVSWRCGCCGLTVPANVPTFPPENRGSEGKGESQAPHETWGA
jgi:hypothetical protein